MVLNCEVDIRSGEVIHQTTDLDLPAVMPLELTRRYVSSSNTNGIFGRGWACNITGALTLENERVVKHHDLAGDIIYSLEDCDGTKGPSLEFSGAISRDLLLSYPDGSRERFRPDPESESRWLIVERQDGVGNAAQYGYTGTRLTEVATSQGYRLELAYSFSGLLECVVLRESKTVPVCSVNYTYDLDRNLVEASDFAGRIERYVYADRLLVRIAGAGRYGKNYVYDRRRRCVGTWSDSGRRVRLLQFDDRGRKVLVTDSYGHRTLFQSDTSGMIVAVVDCQGNVTESISDGAGGTLGLIGPDGSVTSLYQEDSTSHVIRTSDPLGGMWSTQLERGRMHRIISPEGHSRCHEYDIHGRLTRVILPSGASVTYEYDSVGQLCAVTDPLGYRVERHASPDGRLVRLADDYGLLSTQRFDALYNLVSVTDAVGRETKYTYRTVDVPATETGPGGATVEWEYDADWNEVVSRDALGRERRTEYDTGGNITAEIDALRGRVEYIHDLEDNLRTIINEKGERLEVSYDENYNEIATTFFDGRVQRYEADEEGRRKVLIDAMGRRSEFSYHGDANIRAQTFSDGTVHQFDLNPDGRYTAVTCTPAAGAEEPERRLEFAYDPNGNVALVGTGELAIHYEWDLCNHLVGIRDSLGDETRLFRGARHRVERIIDCNRQFDLEYLADGKLSELRYPNGLRQIFGRDSVGRIVKRRMVSPTGKILTWRRFTWNSVDQLTAMEDWHWGSFRYIYDLCGRLISVTDGQGSPLERYQYDATSNLVAGPLAQAVVIESGNRLVSADGQAFTYDANGNLIARREGRNEWSYEWDREDQLRRVWRNGALMGQYEYDLMNRRIRKQVDGLSTEFLYERYGLRAEVYGKGLRHHYVSLPGVPVPIARFSPEGDYYYGFDEIGSPIEMFDETGELTLAVHAHAFGAAREEYRPTGNPTEFPFNFMGQYFDGESRLFYNHFRYYDAAFGRYISQDPLSVSGGTNLYIYPTDPLGWIDPLGLMPTFTCKSRWTACQQWYAREKIKAVNEAMETRTLTRCKTTCRSGYQGDDFRSKRCGRGTYSGQTHAIDHFHDLQMSGFDRCCENHRAIGKNFNNDLNVQINEMFNSNIPKIKVGDVIGKIATTGCLTKGPCSEAGKRQVARKPPGPATPCPPEDQKPLNC